MKSTSVLILAAGKGTRMKSDLPKVLHSVGGIPMIERIVRTVSQLKPKSICLVVGHGADDVKAHLKNVFPHLKLEFSMQRKLDGSGGAVRQANSWLKKQSGQIIITCGDAPLLTLATFRSLMASHQAQSNVATVLTTFVPKPDGYGRIVRSADDSVEKIVEHLDASDDEQKIREINSGSYCFEAAALQWALPRIKNNNKKKEYYLTDTLALLHAKGRVGADVCASYLEALGINSRADLAIAEKTSRDRKTAELMAQGVTFIDPVTCIVDEGVTIAPDTVIWPQTFILGASHIGSGCQIGPWTHIKNTIVEAGATVQASFCEDSIIRKDARVGPYSRVRPKSEIGESAHLGNFSEVKNTKIGVGAKVNHLSYLGDAKIGKCVNIGAGSITCNYDGFQKHPTEIQDHAFIGSNVNLIAPVRVGAGAVVGAGSSISENVPAGALALERAPLKVKKGWAHERAKKGKKK